MPISRRAFFVSIIAAGPALGGAQAAPLSSTIEARDDAGRLAEPAHHRWWHNGGRGRHYGWRKGKHKRKHKRKYWW